MLYSDYLKGTSKWIDLHIWSSVYQSNESMKGTQIEENNFHAP